MLETLVTVVILCNNQNYLHSPRCTAPVESFYETPTGFAGQLESGVEFTQTRITQDLHHFQMEQVEWFIYQGKKLDV